MSRVDDILAAVPLRSFVSTELKSIGRDRYRGACPIREHGSVGPFSVARHPAGHDVWQCFACGLRGSVIDLVAALDSISVGEAIRKLSGNNLPQLSEDATIQRALDAHDRKHEILGVIACDDCRLEFVIVDSWNRYEELRTAGHWMIGRDGSARCPECVKLKQKPKHGNESNAKQ